MRALFIKSELQALLDREEGQFLEFKSLWDQSRDPPRPLDLLRQRKPVHASRNPLIVRLLADVGLMREQGEGIPRIFDEMEGSFLRPPEFTVEAGEFMVTLRNEPTFTGAQSGVAGYSADYASIGVTEANSPGPAGGLRERGLSTFESSGPGPGLPGDSGYGFEGHGYAGGSARSRRSLPYCSRHPGS